MTKLSSRLRVTFPAAVLATALGTRSAAQDGTSGPDTTQLPGSGSSLAWPMSGWTTGPPEDHGLPVDLADQVDAWVADTTPLLTSLLVVRNGALVVDRHYRGFEPGEAYHIWSVTKSITSIAIGIAFGEGLFSDLGQPLGELIPDRNPADADPRVASISLYHLLTSTSGWAWDGRTNFSRHGETDNLELMIGRPLAFEPGTGFEYDSTNSNLLSAIIQERSGVTMAEYLQPRLFDPLGIAPPAWTAMDQGETRGAGGLHLAPGDLAKIGLMVLRGGEWNGQTIVPPDWLSESFEPHASGASTATGVNIGGGGAYGYQWWVKTSLGSVYGNGYGGQILYLHPELDLLVVTGVAGTDVNRPDLQQPVLPIIEQLIVPAAMS